MDLSQMRSRLRSDLHDEDPTDQRWTDAVRATRDRLIRKL